LGPIRVGAGRVLFSGQLRTDVERHRDSNEQGLAWFVERHVVRFAS
jgi:hypothetical protein